MRGKTKAKTRPATPSLPLCRPSRTIAVRFHFSSPLLFFFPRWVSGVTLGRHVFFRRPLSQVSSRLVRHELIHVCQYGQYGFYGFLWFYLWRERKLSYRYKRFELEAFEHQDEDGYRERRWPHLRLELPAEIKGWELKT